MHPGTILKTAFLFFTLATKTNKTETSVDYPFRSPLPVSFTCHVRNPFDKKHSFPNHRLFVPADYPSLAGVLPNRRPACAESKSGKSNRRNGAVRSQPAAG